MGALDYKTRRHRRTRMAAEMYATWTPRRLFTFGTSVGGAHWFTDPNTLYRRRNLLTYTGGSYASPWATDNSGATNPTVTTNYAAAPDGTMTAARVQLNKTGGVFSRLRCVVSWPTGRQYVVSVYARTTSGSGTANVGLRGGDAAGTNMAVSGTWQRFTYALGTITTPADFQILLWDNIAGNDETADILIWGAQLELGSSATEYQAVPTTWPEAYLAAVGAENIFDWVDSAGTTPATAVGDTIGLSLDRAYGGMRGANSWNPASVSLSGESSQVSIGVYRIYSSAGALSFVSGGTTVVGRLYEVQFTIDSITTPGAGVMVGDSGAIFTTTGRKTSVWLANLTFAFIKRNAAATDIQISNVSVREIPGTHLIQATGTARPTLSARVNQLLATEALANAAWVKTGSGTGSVATVTDNYAAAPDGTTTATRIVANKGAGVTSSDFSLVQQVIFWTSTVPVLKVWIKSNTGASQTVYARTVGTNTIVATTSWQLFTITGIADPAPYATFGTRGGTGSDSSIDILVWHPDLRTADDASKAIPAYQRVGATAADHDTDGFPHYALFDGTDDSWASTATVDGSGSDKVTVVAGVTKNSDAAFGVLVELTADSNSNNGAFFVSAPQSASSTIGYKVRGTIAAVASGYNASTYTAPTTRILSLVADLASSVKTGTVKPYIDGVLDQGEDDAASVNFGGNFANATLYVGSRGGSSSRLNGRIYSLVFRFGAMSDTDRNRSEQWNKNLMRLP